MTPWSASAMIKRLILAIIFLVIVVGGLVGFNLFRTQAIKDFFANMQQPAKTVSTITLEPTTWTPGIEAIGSANAINGVDLTVQVSGIVDKIDFKANQEVKRVRSFCNSKTASRLRTLLLRRPRPCLQTRI